MTPSRKRNSRRWPRRRRVDIPPSVVLHVSVFVEDTGALERDEVVDLNPAARGAPASYQFTVAPAPEGTCHVITVRVLP